MNRSYFDILFRNLTVENIIIIFTHLLVQRPVIIVGNCVENMLPIVTSLASLIHPFEMQICLPLIMKDPDAPIEMSSLLILTRNWGYLIGIMERDLQSAIELLEESPENASPLII